MLKLPINNQREDLIPKKAIVKSLSLQNLLEKCSKWDESARFIKREASFLSWLVFKSQSISTGIKETGLQALREEYTQFIEKEVAGFIRSLHEHHDTLVHQKNSKYPPASYDSLYDTNITLSIQLENMENRLKELKLKTFEKVDEFIKVRIY